MFISVKTDGSLLVGGSTKKPDTRRATASKIMATAVCRVGHPLGAREASTLQSCCFLLTEASVSLYGIDVQGQLSCGKAVGSRTVGSQAPMGEHPS